MIRKNRHFTDEEVVAIRELLATGVRLVDAAKAFKTNIEYIRLVKLNRTRPGLGPDVSAVNNRQPNRAKQARSLSEAGYSVRQIAHRMGIACNTINKYLANAEQSSGHQQKRAEIRRQIYELYLTGDYSQAQLGEMFFYSQTHIGKIIRQEYHRVRIESAAQRAVERAQSSAAQTTD